MTDHAEHLTEDERQMMADGSPSDERAAALAGHLARCAACAGDVGRLRAILSRAHAARDVPPDTARDTADADALWPLIRARIDERKSAPFDRGRRAGGAPRWSRGGRPRLVAGIVAAAGFAAAGFAAAGFAIARGVKHRAEAPNAGPQMVAMADAGDSVTAYRDEVRTLLGELELRRAMLRPDALAAIDHDLAVVDSAITELQAALARDPNNPGLRQLLASTYRQEIDILKRVGNAG